jgi:hypothetical protein
MLAEISRFTSVVSQHRTIETSEASNRTNDARGISMTPASTKHIGNATGSSGTNMGERTFNSLTWPRTELSCSVLAKKQGIHAIDLLMPAGTMVYSTCELQKTSQ